MSIRDRDIDDWFRRWPPWGAGRRGGASGRENIFREFEEMRRDIDRVPKELIREYETPTGGKLREVGPRLFMGIL